MMTVHMFDLDDMPGKLCGKRQRAWGSYRDAVYPIDAARVTCRWCKAAYARMQRRAASGLYAGAPTPTVNAQGPPKRYFCISCRQHRPRQGARLVQVRSVRGWQCAQCTAGTAA